MSLLDAEYMGGVFRRKEASPLPDTLLYTDTLLHMDTALFDVMPTLPSGRLHPMVVVDTTIWTSGRYMLADIY